MVSKKRSINDKEAGPSKKRGKTEAKSQKTKNKEQEVVNTAPEPKKKRGRKSTKFTKVTTETIEKEENIELPATNTNENPSDSLDVLTEARKTTENVNSNNYGVPTWPVPHMSELLRKIENVLPTVDQMAYKSRADKLDWDEIAFDNYTGADCRVMWDTISKRVRRFRILKELVDDAKNWISKPWTNFYRGSKNNRHPDLPRRPLSTYMIFYLKKKDKILQENPGLEMTDLSKHIAEMYKKIPPKTKKKYQELAAIQRKEYDEKMEEFNRLHPDLIPNHSKGVVHTTPDNVPKKPPTPFKLFCEDKMKRAEHDANFDKNSFLEKCKEQWKNMSDKKKVFWINWAFDKEVKFQDEMKKYIAENPEYTSGTVKSILTKDERTLRERMAGKPEKPPNSAYSLFSRLMLASEDVKNVNPKERMLLIAQQWKNCSDVEKKDYSDRVKHMLEQYKLQYAEYLESLPEDKRQEELQNNQPKRKRTVVAKQKTKEGTEKKRVKKTTNTTVPKKKVNKTENSKLPVKKSDCLYPGEPEPPPATPYLMFSKNYDLSYPERNNAHEVWEKLPEEKRIFYRRVLNDLKKVYIESYEDFLKRLTPEQLKEYSEWKKTAKLAAQDPNDDSSDDDDSDSECSNNSDSGRDDKTGVVKKELDNSDSSSSSE